MVFPNSSMTGWMTGSSLKERGCWNGHEVRQRPASEATNMWRRKMQPLSLHNVATCQ